MFEVFLQRFLAVIGASDTIIAAGGPGGTFVFAVLFGVFTTQTVKFLYANDLREPWFSRVTRIIAIVSSIAFAHFLADSLNPAWEIAAGMSAIGFYHGTLACIRRWWPWFEMKHFVGAVEPPRSAQVAEAVREAEKSGENSGT